MKIRRSRIRKSGKRCMLGIIVHGSNHFIVAGPLPDPACARILVRRWELPRIGAPASAGKWSIITKAFREDLRWAVVLAGDSAIQSAVAQLLAEVEARGVTVHRGAGPLLPRDEGASWHGEPWSEEPVP